MNQAASEQASSPALVNEANRRQPDRQSQNKQKIGVLVEKVILTAKLGRHRKDAQIDTCDVFAAALYDVIRAHNIPCRIFNAACQFSLMSTPDWYHGVVKVKSVYYDSLGVFNKEIVRKRNKTHPTVNFEILMKPDRRIGYFDTEFDELHAFYVKQLTRAFKNALS